MSSGSIHNDDFIILLSEKSDTFFSDLYGIGLCAITVEGTLNFSRILLELLEGTGTECIGTH